MMSLVSKIISPICDIKMPSPLQYSFRKTRHNFFGSSDGDHHASYLFSCCGLFLMYVDL